MGIPRKGDAERRPDAAVAAESHQAAAMAQETPNCDRLELLPLLRSLNPIEPLSMVLGITSAGRPLVVDLRNASTQHLLITGAAGSGKSEMLRILAVSLALTSRPSQVQMLGIDVGGRELALLEAFPHTLAPLASDACSALELLSWLDGEIRRRRERGVRHPKAVLVVDDVRWLEDVEFARGARRLLCQGNEGPELGVHLIIGARPESLAAVPGFQAMRSLVTLRSAGEGGGWDAGTRSGFAVTSAGRLTRLTPAWLGVHDLAAATERIGLGWRLDHLAAGRSECSLHRTRGGRA